MSDHFPRKEDPFSEDTFEDYGSPLDEEAVLETNPDVNYEHDEYTGWDGAEDEMPLVDEYDHQNTDYYEDDIEIGDSFYDPPAPPILDDPLLDDERFEGNESWLQKNWWRLAIVILLVGLIAFLLVRSCGNSKTSEMPTTVPSPTRIALPTFTPTPQTELLPPTNMGSADNQTTPAEDTAPATAATATPVPQPTPVPATGGKFYINQVVIVTGTDKDKLSFRWGPGQKYARRSLIKDGTKLTVIGGPEKADGHTWWRLQTSDGTIGWAVEDYLRPAQ